MKLHPIFAFLLAAVPAVAAERPPDPIEGGVIVARLEPGALAAPAPLSEPIVFAQGTLGIPRVIAWAGLTGTSGLTWGSTASVATATQASITYSNNGTSLRLNAPDTGRITFAFNLTTSLTIADDGTDSEIIIPGGSTLDFTDGTNTLLQIADGGSVGNLNVTGAITADGSISADVDGTRVLLTNGCAVFSGGSYPSLCNVGSVTSLNIVNANVLTIGDGTGGNTLATFADAGTTARFGLNNAAGTYLALFTDAHTATTQPADLGILLTDSQGTPRIGGWYLGGANDFVVGARSDHTVTLTVEGTDNPGVSLDTSTNTVDIQFNGSDGGSFVEVATDKARAQFDFYSSYTANGTITFEDQSGNDLATLTDGGTTGNFSITGNAFGFGNATTLSFHDGTNNLVQIVDNGALGTLTILSGTGVGLQFNDSNVSISENATNDLAFAADSAERVVISSVGLIIDAGGVLQFADSSTQISETGTNDLLLTADATSVMTLTGSLITIPNGVATSGGTALFTWDGAIHADAGAIVYTSFRVSDGTQGLDSDDDINVISQSCFGIDFASITLLTADSAGQTYTGAAPGDICTVVGLENAYVTGSSFSCRVSASNTVTVRHTCVNGAAGTCDPADTTYCAMVTEF